MDKLLKEAFIRFQCANKEKVIEHHKRKVHLIYTDKFLFFLYAILKGITEIQTKE